jgi:phenylalanyl-tRNA synthetase alpha chain
VSHAPLTWPALRHALSLRDLTDPSQGPHALQLLVDSLSTTLLDAWRCRALHRRDAPIVSVADNYDRLQYPAASVARESRYTRYVSEDVMLRSHTSAMIPSALRTLARTTELDDVLIVAPGITYRRDSIDRLHTGEPHQIDLWRVRVGSPLSRDDLRAMVARVVDAVLPGAEHVLSEATHPYTLAGLQIDVKVGDRLVEIGECGLAHPEVLRDAGLDPARWSGLAMGLGLDRLLMLRKGIDDIRLLRATDERVASQMLDLTPYRPVSTMPPVRRDLSIAVATGTTDEDLGDRVRSALRADAELVESVAVVERTPASALSELARARIGLGEHQENVLLRVVLRAVDRTLTHAECNRLRDAIYAAVHEGSAAQWASRGAA